MAEIKTATTLTFSKKETPSERFWKEVLQKEETIRNSRPESKFSKGNAKLSILKEETSSERVWREVFQEKEATRNFRLELKLSNDTTRFLSLIAENKEVAYREAHSLMQKLAQELKIERAFWRFSGSRDWQFVSAVNPEKRMSSFKKKVSKIFDYFFPEEDED